MFNAKTGIYWDRWPGLPRFVQGLGHATVKSQNPHPNVGSQERGWDQTIAATLGWGTLYYCWGTSLAGGIALAEGVEDDCSADGEASDC